MGSLWDACRIFQVLLSLCNQWLLPDGFFMGLLSHRLALYNQWKLKDSYGISMGSPWDF